MPSFITDNPAAFLGAARAIVIAVLGLVVSFGFKITPEQQTAILDFTGAVVAVSALFTVATVKATVPKAPSADATPASIQAPVPTATIVSPPPAP